MDRERVLIESNEQPVIETLLRGSSPPEQSADWPSGQVSEFDAHSSLLLTLTAQAWPIELTTVPPPPIRLENIRQQWLDRENGG